MTKPYILQSEHGLLCWCAIKRVWYWPRAWRYQGDRVVQCDAECMCCNTHGGTLRPGEKPQPHTYLVRS
jgi:hypothetical protein